MLKNKLELVEEQNMELKKEGLDFKTTILTAQKFADNLRQTSEEEAERMMQEARDDVEKFRNDAHVELARLPKEIDDLKQKKKEVREELRVTLQSYLSALDAFSNEDSEKDDDLSDLFQSIQIPDEESVDPDDIDNIEMNL
jgi:BMFP domain-containing protein YqiC